MSNDATSGDAAPAVAGTPLRLLRLEGAALLAAAVATYWQIGASRWMFILLILAPDLSFLAYPAGPRVGAAVYNAAHTTLGGWASSTIRSMRSGKGMLSSVCSNRSVATL